MKSRIPGQHIGHISKAYARVPPTSFYKTGIADFDRDTGGLPSGELTILAARPGVGKTSLAMQVLEHIGAHHKTPSGIFSIEMSGRSLVTRMVLARVPLSSLALRQGSLNAKEMKLRDKALDEIAKLPIYIDDSSANTISHVEKVAAQWYRAGLRFFALDYVQLLMASNRTSDTRTAFIGEAAWRLKQIAKKYDVPFLVLSQLNRSSTLGKRRPTAADLRESGDLEQVADNIILLHPDVNQRPNVDIIREKWRNGLTGITTVHFDGQRTTFESVHREE